MKQEKRKQKLAREIKQDVLIDSAEIIKFENYTNRMYDSNLWKLFPQLEKVTIIVNTSKNYGKEHIVDAHFGTVLSTTQKVYTRDGYKQRHAICT